MNRNTISIRISQQNKTERIGILLCGVCDIVLLLESAPTVWIGILLVLVSANKTNRNRNTISITISISQQNETERIGILLVLESAPTVWIGILLVLVSANRTNRSTISNSISSNSMNRNTISISWWWWYLGGSEVSWREGCLCNTYKQWKCEVLLGWEPQFVQNRNLSD